MFLKARNHSFSRPRRGRFLALLAGRTDSNGQCKRQWLSKILGGPADFFFAAKPVLRAQPPPNLYGTSGELECGLFAGELLKSRSGMAFKEKLAANGSA